MNVAWNGVEGATGYELLRDNTLVYDGIDFTVHEKNLVSDTTYSYSISAKNQNGKSVPVTNQFKTNVGELSLIEVPTAVQTAGVTLNGSLQKKYANVVGKIIVKDTRKVRGGWKLTVQSTELSNNRAANLANSIAIKPITSIQQKEGLIAIQPGISTSVTKLIDGSDAVTLVSAGSDTGYGIYEITLPPQALEYSVVPSAYSGDYSTNITWNLEAGN